MNEYFIKDVRARLDSICNGMVIVNPNGLGNYEPTVVNVECYGTKGNKPIFSGTTEYGFNYIVANKYSIVPPNINEWRIGLYRPNNKNEVSIQVISKEQPTDDMMEAWCWAVFLGLPDKGKRWFTKNIEHKNGYIWQITPTNAPFAIVDYHARFKG